MICEKCKEYCLCATCVYNPYYAVNTPKPCIGADCDICIGDGETIFCNRHMNLEGLNKKVKEMKE